MEENEATLYVNIETFSCGVDIVIPVADMQRDGEVSWMKSKLSLVLSPNITWYKDTWVKHTLSSATLLSGKIETHMAVSCWFSKMFLVRVNQEELMGRK